MHKSCYDMQVYLIERQPIFVAANGSELQMSSGRFLMQVRVYKEHDGARN